MKSIYSFLNESTENSQCIIEECEGIVFVDEETGIEYITDLDEETLLKEYTRKIRITSRGQRIRRIKCPPGRILKTVNGRKTCVVPTGTQKLKKRLAIRKAIRTKKAKGANYRRRISFKRSRGLRRRKAMGIRPGQ